MSDKTLIEWCDYTWSPWLGCRKVSPGCQNCYITSTTPFRTRKITHGSQRVRTSEAYWNQPLAWNRKAERDGTRPRVFPSLCDPFDEDVPIPWRTEFFDLIWKTPYLTWLLLTKRPAMAKRALEGHCAHIKEVWPNVWLGVSVEDQQRADERIPILLSIPAKVRFLSVEPMLERIDFSEVPVGMLGPLRKTEPNINWVIVGMESGPNRRDCGVEPLISVVQQCTDASVPVFVKQDCALRPGQQGRIPDEVWAKKEFPTA